MVNSIYLDIKRLFVRQQEGNGPIDERRRLNLAADLKSVTSITYISMCILQIYPYGGP